MHTSSTRFFTGVLASAVSACLALSAIAPALADPHDRTVTTRATAAPAPRAVERTYTAPRAVERTYTAPRAVERTYTAPRAVERTYTAPRAVERTYTAPRAVERTYTAPRAVERTYTAPRAVERTYTAPRAVERTYTAPRAVERTYTAPRAVERTYTAPRAVERTYTAPRAVERTYSAPRTVQRSYTAPRTVERTYRAPRTVERTYRAPRTVERTYTSPRTVERTYRAPRTVERSYAAQRNPAPFAERVNWRTTRSNNAPFVQYVRTNRANRTANWTTVRDRQVAGSPLMRAVYATRTNRSVAYYHPAYLTGRIVRERRNYIVLAPQTGPQVIVTGYVPPTYVVNQYVTVPAVYNNGSYYTYPPAYSNGYYYPQQRAYTPWYSNYAAYQTTYPSYPSYPSYPAYPSYSYDNSGCGYGDNDGDEYGCSSNYDSSYDSYNNNTPYDNCVWTYDANGNSYCAAPQINAGYNNGYPYNSYAANGMYGTYAPQQVQGLVVAETGSMLMVLGGNGLSPIFVNDAMAMQSGYAVNGPPAIGQLVDAYGYYNGNTFVATALM